MFPIFEIQGTFNFGVMNASSSSALKKEEFSEREMQTRNLKRGVWEAQIPQMLWMKGIRLTS